MTREEKMKKILFLSIALILVAGVISLAIADDIDTTTYSVPTGYAKDRHIVRNSDGYLVVLYQGGSSPLGIRAKMTDDDGVTWCDLNWIEEESTQISSSTSKAFSICLHPVDDYIYVTYEGSNNIYFRKLIYSGSDYSVGDENLVDGENVNANPSIILQEESEGYYYIWVAYGHDTPSGALVRAKYVDAQYDFDYPSVEITAVSAPVATANPEDYYPALTISYDDVEECDVPFIAYQSYQGLYDIKWSKWDAYEVEWPTPEEISGTTADGFSVTKKGDDVHLVYRHPGDGIKYSSYTYTTSSWSTPETLSGGEDAARDRHPSLTTDDTDLLCFASIYYDTNKYNIKYKKWHNGNWYFDWRAVTTDNANNLYSTTPSSCTVYSPLAWTYGTASPYTVKFDSTVAAADNIAPAAINTLDGTCDGVTIDVELTWNAPGDDGMEFPLDSGSKYIIDYSSDSAKQWDKGTFEVEISTSGVTPGSQVSRTIPGLQNSTTWYFRIWTRDEVPNWSGISNGCTVWVLVTTNKYWVGATNWNNANNWSYESGGTGEAGVPVPGDIAIFDGANTNSCQIDTSAIAHSVIIYSTYTATVFINSGQSLTTLGSFNIAGGTFTTNGGLLDVGSYSQTDGIFNAGASTITCSGNFTITVGTFNAGASALILDGASGQTLTSGGNSFYDLKLAGGSVTLGDALNIIHDFTCISPHAGSLGGSNVTIGNDFQFDNGPLGIGGTWTVAGNWDTSSGVFGPPGGSGTVDLTGSGNLSSGGCIFRNLKVASAEKTTTLQSNVTVANTLTLGTGTLTGAPDYSMILTPTVTTTPLVNDGATIILDKFIYKPPSDSPLAVLVAGGNYGTLNYLKLIASSNYFTFSLGGDIEVTGTFWLVAESGLDYIDFNTQDKNLTATGLYFGDGSDTGSTTVICGTSTITIGTGGLDMANNGGSHTLNLSGATITCAGDWQLSDGSGSITQNPGTSTVTFDNASSTSTLTGSTTFYGLVSTTTGKTVKFSSDTVTGVTGHLNFENIILRSTLQGATWYLNLNPSATQDVSGVNVQDSNASDGETIVAANSIDSGNNTNWDFEAADGTAPAAITDLTGLCNSDTGDVTLSWSTPGDDEWTGPLPDGSMYIIDYATYTVQWSTENYKVDISTSGVAPHTEVSYKITGLTGDTTWYFQIWTRDEVPNWSGLSNGATIYVNPVLSVSISTNTYDFGDVPLGVSTHTVSVITVTNEGNVNETYSLKISSVTLYDNSPSLWKSTDTTTGHNRFISYAIFHGTDVASGYFELTDAVVDENRSSTGERYTYEDGSPPYKQTGQGVPPGEERKIWFRLDMPTSTTTGKEEKITVTITAGPE